MEKISIVKRRKKGSLEPDKEQTTDIYSQTLPPEDFTEIPASVLGQSETYPDRDSAKEESTTDTGRTVSVNLTPEQYNFVKSNQYVKYFLNGDSSGVSLDVQKQPDGQIIFNFQFKKVETVKMLKPEHVCQMLQISKSLLLSLVKAGKIRSYKLGRLRRFLLEDILDYLSKCEEIFNLPNA